MSQLAIIPLGGMGQVTQNMYLYIYGDEIFIVDCGIGFPDVYMPGVDILIPDTYYLLKLLEEGKKIVGLLLTHGHDDHIAATQYILPELPDDFPIFASPLTAGFARQRMGDAGISRDITVIRDREEFQVGQHFQVTPYAVTHSVPDTKHFTINTPEGMVYHGSDFKLDKNPVDGVEPDYEAFKEMGEKNQVMCMLIDCLRVERSEWTASESVTGPAIEKAMGQAKGKFLFSSMSSHIHRIQQTVNAAKKYGRKIVFIGRSVEQNVDVAIDLKKLDIPKGMLINKRKINSIPDNQLCIIIAGSQGQEGSSMMRAIFGEHRAVSIMPNDLVVFSADAIPGNQIPYYGAIDELARNQIRVLYPDVMDDLHASGHASAPEQRELVGLVKPKYVMPIGGADRHREKFKEFVSRPLGLTKDQTILPQSGQAIYFKNGKPQLKDEFQIRPRMVDGKGVGDVGPVVLSDRRALSEAGIIVLIIPRVNGQLDLSRTLVISRGFVFMKEAEEVVEFIKKKTAEIVSSLKGKTSDHDIKRAIEGKLGRELYKVIQREPIIVPVIYERT